MSEEKEIKIPEKFKDIVEKIEKLSVIELSELVKVFEEKFSVSAQATVVAASSGQGDGGEKEEKSTFSIEIKSTGDQKVQVIKVLKEVLNLGLKEAKDITDKAPVLVKDGMDKKSAEELKAKLEAAGATIELK